MGSACTVMHCQGESELESHNMCCQVAVDQQGGQDLQLQNDFVESPRTKEAKQIKDYLHRNSDNVIRSKSISSSSTSKYKDNHDNEVTIYPSKYEIDLSSPGLRKSSDQDYAMQIYLDKLAKKSSPEVDLMFDSSDQIRTTAGTGRNMDTGRDNAPPENTRRSYNLNKKDPFGRDCVDYISAHFQEVDLDDPVYIVQKEVRTSILSENMDTRPFVFRLDDWKRADETEHNFSKLVLQLKYMCTQIDKHEIEYDVWVDMLLEWSKNLKHLGKGMQVAQKDFETRADHLTKNRDLLLKHKLITKDSREYKYLMDFIQLEVDLGIHKANVTNNDIEINKAIESCQNSRNLKGQKIITAQIAKDLIKNNYCATCRNVLRAAWFFELQENIYYNFCTYREDEMHVIGRKCYNKYLAPKHNWVQQKICNWALKLLIKRETFTTSFIQEQKKVQCRNYTENDLIEEMWEAHPYIAKIAEYIWAYYRERDMADLP